MWVQSLGREDPLEEGIAAPSSILAWRISCTEKPSGLQSMESQRVGQYNVKEFVFNYFASLGKRTF